MLFQLIASNKRWRFSLYGIIAFITVTNVTSAIIILTWCRPTKKIWNPTVPGECWSGDAAKWVAVYLNGGLYYSMGWRFSSNKFEITIDIVPAILCDTTLALIPVVFLWKVQINIRTKVGICCLMGLGLMWVIDDGSLDLTYDRDGQINEPGSSASCAIVRTIMNSKLPIHDVTCKNLLQCINRSSCTRSWLASTRYMGANRHLVDVRLPHMRFNQWSLTILNRMENLIGIIAACAATLKPLLRLKPISDWRSSRSGYISQSKHRLKLLNSPSPIGFKPEDSSSNIGNQTRATGHGQNTELSDDPSYIIEDPFHIKKTTEFEVHESWGHEMGTEVELSLISENDLIGSIRLWFTIRQF